jgi:hypothetical protein
VSTRSQIALVWWALTFATFYFVCLRFLLDMFPPPGPGLSAAEVAQFYVSHAAKIRVGAVLASYCSAFMVPLTVVVAAQMSRQENVRKVWTMMTLCGGALMSIFLVLPPLFWGVAAFTPSRMHDVTAIMHELGLLSLVTTDQFYIFMWVAIVVVCLSPSQVKYSPFPRWFGYFSAWVALMFEAGAIAFAARSGPFAWNGLLTFWLPFVLAGVWIPTMSCLLLINLRRQAADPSESPIAVATR